MITLDMVKAGYEVGLIRLIDASTVLGDGIACSIGDNWFYFGGQTAEEYTDVEKYKNDIPKEDIIKSIFDVLEQFSTAPGFEDEYLYYEFFLNENGIVVQEIESGPLKRIEVEKYFIEQGRPDADESWYDEFMNAGEKQHLYDEIVRNNYDLSDVDRWFHLMKVMGVDLDWKTASAINSTLWEADIETMELNTQEDVVSKTKEGALNKSNDLLQKSVAVNNSVVSLWGRLGVQIDVSPDEFEVLRKNDKAAKDLLVSLIKSDRCYLSGESYFPPEPNEEYISDSLEFDIDYQSIHDFNLEKMFDVESPDIIALRGNIHNLRKELDGAIAYDSDMVPGIEKRLLVSELKLNAALEGVTLNLDPDDIIDAQHLDSFWYCGYIGSLEYRGYNVDVKATGDVCFSVLSEDLKDELVDYRNPDYDVALSYIEDDVALKKLVDEGRVVFSSVNRVEFTVFDENEHNVTPGTCETVLNSNNVLDAFSDVGYFKQIIDEIEQNKVVGKDKDLNQKFIFDDELMINDDHESINGYLWALDVLVDRLPQSQTMDNINFYADYNVVTGDIKLISSYYAYAPTKDREINWLRIVPLTDEEKVELVATLEAYCKKEYSLSCLEFVNEMRRDYNLPEVVSEDGRVSLSEQIRSANKAKVEQAENNENINKGPIR